MDSRSDKPQTIILEKNIGSNKQKLFDEDALSTIRDGEEENSENSRELTIEFDRETFVRYFQLITFLFLLLASLVVSMWLVVDGVGRYILPSIQITGTEMGDESQVTDSNDFGVVIADGPVPTIENGTIDHEAANDFGEVVLDNEVEPDDSEDQVAPEPEIQPEEPSTGNINTNDPEPLNGGISTVKFDYTYRANRGDGVSKLARRAMIDYVENNKLNFDRYQKIYFETKLASASNPVDLEIGESRTFDPGLMEELSIQALSMTKQQKDQWAPYLAGYPL